MKVKCHFCGKRLDISVGQYNYRVLKHGLNVYCNKKCAGLGRRVNRTDEENRMIKYFYDAFRYLIEADRLKKQRAEYFKRDYAANPEKYRKERQRRMKAHVQYCRQPSYRKKKKVYDQQRVAKKNYGEFWEAAIALRELGAIVDNRKAKQDQKTINKTQNRKRYANKNTKRKELESCTVGLYQPS